MKELFMAARGTSGAFRNDLLTPDVRESSATISCRGFTTGIPGANRVGGGGGVHCSRTSRGEGDHEPLTCCHQLGLIFLIPHLLLLHITAREEETHHSVEELVGELDGERHHIHLWEGDMSEPGTHSIPPCPT
uniref:Uncharacterized protein n=1 Tax=Corvus moneduloides TaxID=1196302 RepID=A0A8C3E6F7_CORMO